MRLSKAWLIAAKDLHIFLKKRNLLYSAAVLPLVISIGLPLLLRFISNRPAVTAQIMERYLNAFSILPVILATIIPTSIASYSMVGEKVQKSLEPLLAAPITDSELLLGKAIASFIPSIVASYLASVIYTVLSDVFSRAKLGFNYYPNSTAVLLFLALTPLAVILSIGYNVLVSSRVSDVRTAQTLGFLAVLPFGIIYILSEIGIFSLDIQSLWIIAGAVFLVDILLFFFSGATFQREKILTEWK